MASHLCAALVAGILAVAALVPPASAATPQELSDLDARGQAAYHAGDVTALQALAQRTVAWQQSAEPMERYATALVQFRLAQLATTAKREKELEKAGTACTQILAPAVTKDPRFAEGFALQSACYGYLTGTAGFPRVISLGKASGKAMDAAIALEPRNPRVILVDAIGLNFRPRIAGGDPAKAFARAREAAAAFDAAPPAAPGQPSWGHAEAWYWVGRGAEQGKDVAGARKAYARAVQIAPDFSAAKKRLATLGG